MFDEHTYTGKERDAESGLDYFGARHYGSNLGRFMSPDPIFFQASMLIDPQRFNLYAYVRNNPLRFVDPKGESIELTGDEEERKKELVAVQSAVGKPAGSYLYENKVITTDANGNTSTRYYVGVYTNGADGKGPAFDQVNGAASAIGSIISNREVVQASIVSNGTVLRNDQGAGVKIGSIRDGQTPGLTYVSHGVLRVAILDPSTDPGQLPADLMSNSQPGVVDQGILMGHELGHAGDSMGAVFATSSARSAVLLENSIRKNRDPNAPIRTEH